MTAKPTEASICLWAVASGKRCLPRAPGCGLVTPIPQDSGSGSGETQAAASWSPSPSFSPVRLCS